MNKGVVRLFWIVEIHDYVIFGDPVVTVEAVFSHFDDAKDYVECMVDRWGFSRVEWSDDGTVVECCSGHDPHSVTVYIKNGQGGPVKTDLLGP